MSITRRRSFHLTHTTPAQQIETTTVSANLLALAHQASALAVTLVGGCMPGPRQHKQAPRPLLAGTYPPKDHVKEDPSASLSLIRVRRRNSVILDAHEAIEATCPSVSASNRPPTPKQVRSDIVRRVQGFTTARMSRLPEPSLSPFAPSSAQLPTLDDPFASPTSSLPSAPSQHPQNPATLHFLALARTQFLSVRGTQNSPTPVIRTRSRASLRQQTVYFQQPASPPRMAPKFWQPHPAGKKSCAIRIEAPSPADKENTDF
ncbi:hypothetical protein MIND_01017400 [Mycena indigotica]|uniref:Uncharacterized protein n=1 Tax=Mycena indigotica TaxID=2126181 RepID=A0A8H6VUW0_9AGAR|nr:uncharacterized protein MIND_01017400 [Mycena indigotica]KAF7294797.1 hypothetical protein MIND_01017400 [Mycena indigotica]